ncbi:MAG: OmpA family protein, partial [Bacteroidota bacterium]
DSLGTNEYNRDLGLKRALSVSDYLSFSGIDKTRIESVTKGEETPNYPNHSDAHRKLNRSALIDFYRKK